MKVVVDSNRLRSDELRWFLSQSTANMAVLTDYVWMEAYKIDSTTTIPRSLAILCETPDQVVLLKGTKTIGALHVGSPGLLGRMAVPKGPREFKQTCLSLRQLAGGDPRVAVSLKAHEAVAKQQMERMLIDASQMTPALKDLECLFTVAEVRDIRTCSAYSTEVINKTLVAAGQMYHSFRAAHPNKPRVVSRSWRLNAFLYRMALACVVYVINWIRRGSQLHRKPDVIRNDLVDLNFAVFGTYFNGLMTADHRLQETHAELRAILSALGANTPRAYDVTEYLVLSPETAYP